MARNRKVFSFLAATQDVDFAVFQLTLTGCDGVGDAAHVVLGLGLDACVDAVLRQRARLVQRLHYGNGDGDGGVKMAEMRRFPAQKCQRGSCH